MCLCACIHKRMGCECIHTRSHILYLMQNIKMYPNLQMNSLFCFCFWSGLSFLYHHEIVCMKSWLFIVFVFLKSQGNAFSEMQKFPINHCWESFDFLSPTDEGWIMIAILLLFISSTSIDWSITFIKDVELVY